jgi:outer membrane protein OmpA-like peptidoglycan-associated protein
MFLTAEPDIHHGRMAARQLGVRSATGFGPSPSAQMLIGLQRSAGNAAVAGRLARQRSPLAGTRPAGLPAVVQRCGPNPCDCSDDERADYAATHSDEDSTRDEDSTHDSEDDAAHTLHTHAVQRTLHTHAVQRNAAPPVAVQRHAGFRTKPRLEVPELDPLQFAASRTDRALEFGRDQNKVEVTRLQEGLAKAGFPVPATGVYDAATKAAVAKFQAAHGIPFPTGRQAGPKTLSTLDDHLLGGAKPKPECTQYQPGERQASFGNGGLSTFGGFAQHLRMFNFAAGVHLMKFDHQQALLEYIKKFDLANPDPCEQRFVVESIIGFTDPIDREADNANLRQERAFQVSDFLHSHGVPTAPDGQPGGPSTVCTPPERTRDRAVEIRLKPAPRPPKEQCEPKPGPTPTDPDDPCKATRWQIRIKPLSLSPPKLPAGVTGLVLFAELTMLRSDQQPRSAELIFAGAGQGLSTPNPIPLGACTETVAPFQTFSPKGFSDFEGAGLSVFLNIHVKNTSQLALPPPTNPAAIDTSGYCFPPSLSEGTVPGRWVLGFNPCPTKDDVR